MQRIPLQIKLNEFSGNGTSQSYGINIRQHSTVMPELKNKLLYVSSYSITQVQGGASQRLRDDRMVSHDGDYVKNVKSFQNIARAVDLYLALENAYKMWDYFGWAYQSNNVLLNYQEKQELNIALKGATERMHDWLYKHHALGLREYKLEPGNRPLKGFLAMGYTTLTVQNPFDHTESSNDGIQERQDFDKLCSNHKFR